MLNSSFFKTTIAGAAIALTSCCAQAVSEPTSEISKKDKAALEKIVHEYIVENPEVIIEALQALEAKEELADAKRKEEFYPAFLEMENLPSLGDENAPITVIEFFDYNCGFCKRSTDWALKQANEKDVRFIFVELPVLDSGSKTSALAARAALAANNQGKYIEMHTALMKANGLTKGRILKIAENEGIDVQQLSTDMESATVYRQLDDIMKLAQKADIMATPSFYLNGKFVSGANIPLLEKHLREARG